MKEFVSIGLGSHMIYLLPQPNTFSSFSETYRKQKRFLAFWEAEHELKLLFFLHWLQKKTCYVCYKAFTLYVIQNL